MTGESGWVCMCVGPKNKDLHTHSPQTPRVCLHTGVHTPYTHAQGEPAPGTVGNRVREPLTPLQPLPSH